MSTVVYLSNQFPSPVEPYVCDEIEELRSRGQEVVPCSARRPAAAVRLDEALKKFSEETLYLWPLRPQLILRSAWHCFRHFQHLADFARRILLTGHESPLRRARALVHTFLGVYLAILLQERAADHIHVHHGYFSAWIGMVAARVLGIDFSMTLHGSDLFLGQAYLDLKLQRCKFCVTVSEYNRRHILDHFPSLDPQKILVQRLGIEAPRVPSIPQRNTNANCLVMLAVGRLQPVKDHAFLIQTCRCLKQRNLNFLCLIAGEGPERKKLERLNQGLGLEKHVQLLGHVPRQQLDSYYEMANVVVLTSRSEGLPLVLMEAMAHERIVLAPSITGIPELVSDSETGFLYSPGCIDEFVLKVELIRSRQDELGPIRLAARRYVLQHFHRKKNLASFADAFLSQLNTNTEATHENPVLQ